MTLQYDFIELYPTNHCQLHCIGCYLNQRSQEWNEETARKILNSGIFSRVEKEVSILGGEPTQWKYLLDFVYAIRKENNNVGISITTNAMNLLDDDYRKQFIDCCVTNRVRVNVSWHNDYKIIPVLQSLKKSNVLNTLIFVPNSLLGLDELESVFKKLNVFCRCVWRPLIFKEPSMFAKKITDFLLKKPKNTIQSGVRILNKKKVSNLELVGQANLNKDFYKSFDCQCGRNAVVYTDGKLYHCLSQAIEGYKPLSVSNTKEVKWRSCNYDYCCCDTFDLRSKKDDKQ